MQAIKCEMCGSTDFVKQDGLFVCQHCGAKYTVEEAKKLMVEGTVKIDTTEKLDNLRVLAERARATGNTAKAQEYYEQILLEDPEDIEASFYAGLYQSMNCKLGEMEDKAIGFDRIIRDILIRISAEDVDKSALLNDVVTYAIEYASFIKGNVDGNDQTLEIGLCVRSLLAVSTMLYALGDNLEIEYKENQANNIVRCWSSAIKIEYEMIYSFITNTESRKKYRDEIVEYSEKIKKYKPDFKTPEVFIRGESQKGGCYVATCVYGSYDCPQVWTLRRYRDDTLRETWYGRAFIKVYYAVSPTLVKWFGDTKWFKKMWKGKLDRMVARLQAEGVSDTPYYQDRA